MVGKMVEPAVSDGVVTLRSWEVADAPAIVDCLDGDAELAGWLDRIPQPYTRADAELYIALEGEEKLAITDGSGRVLGSIGLTWQEPTVTEAGYWIRADARRQGLVTRALLLASRYAFDKGAVRVQLRADPENVASCRVAEKAGFTREGLLRQAHWNPRLGRQQDWVMYSLLRDELA
jgi:RimJ/RimL family protein N-acetyltransferase